MAEEKAVAKLRNPASSHEFKLLEWIVKHDMLCEPAIDLQSYASLTVQVAGEFASAVVSITGSLWSDLDVPEYLTDEDGLPVNFKNRGGIVTVQQRIVTLKPVLERSSIETNIRIRALLTR